MGEKLILQNTLGGGNKCGRMTGTIAALPAGQQKGAGRGNT